MATQAKQKQGQELADAAGGVGWTFTWIDNLAYQIERQLEELSPRESVVRVKWMRGVATALLKELRAASAAPDLVAALRGMLEVFDIWDDEEEDEVGGSEGSRAAAKARNRCVRAYAAGKAALAKAGE